MRSKRLNRKRTPKRIMRTKRPKRPKRPNKTRRPKGKRTKKSSRKTRRSFIKSRKNNRKLKGGMYGAPMSRGPAKDDIYLTVKTHTGATPFYGHINKDSTVEDLVSIIKEQNPNMGKFVLHKTIPKYLGYSYEIGEQLKEGTLSDNGVSDGDILSAVFTNTLSSQGELDDRAMGGLGP